MYEYECVIRKIVDGDTIYADVLLGFGVVLHGSRGRGVNIRLYGIDTPESRTRNKQEKKYGLLAKKFVQDFIPVGSTAILKTKKKGKYGRYLGDFKVGRKWLCKELLKNHHAVEYTGQNKKLVAAGHIANRSRVILDVG
tara:strand:+ start:1652 stop:2068 length:417 start_codon:yes stop_codon:yes gene_type:complete